MRAPVMLAALLAVPILAPSCQWAGDPKAARASFVVLKQQVEDVSSRLYSAIESGENDRVLGLDKELNTTMDAAMKQSSAMNLLDREHLAINVATARRCLTDMDRFAQSGDSDLLKNQAQQLKPTVDEIVDLLDRANRTTADNPADK
ncbi:MAG TPA: hypothetical protein VK527_02165 [Candidatus Limnocylindrales bacterium]|nr:hypothetical protein [Candidatus Limnocylindrales bacterium]